MKKLFVFLVVLMAAVMLVFPASAAQTATFSVSASNTAVLPGDTFTVTVSTSKVDNCTVGGFLFSYDKDAFEYVSGVSVLTGFTAGVSTQAGNVAGYFMNGEATVQGDIFQITLKVKDSASGAYTISGTPNMTAGGESVSCSTNSVTVTVSCAHQHVEWTKVNDNQHQSLCRKCQEPKIEDHSWDEGVANPGPGCDTPGTIVYHCLLCNAPKSENVDPIGHRYDNDCDTTCNNGCGTTRTVSHNYVLATDKEYHWYKCSCGELKPGSRQKHTPGPAATETSAQLCTVCEYEIAPILAHVHDVGEVWVSDGQSHWRRCTKKGCQYVEQKKKHDYDDNCDVSCNTCNYIRNDAPHNFGQELKANADGHWQVCTKCGAKSEMMDHVPGPEATETTAQICTECNIVLKMELSHVHEYGDTWYSDEECHWQSCAGCIESTDAEDHIWDEGVELEDGNILYTCSVCAYELTSSEPMASEPETTPPTQAPTVPQPTEPGESEGFPWQWAGIAAIVLFVVGIVLLMIEITRSRKANTHGKFSD